MSAFDRAAVRLLDAIWPRACEAPGCGRRADRPDSLLCSACAAALPYASGAACSKCGRTFPGQASADFVCDLCLKEKHPAFDRACHALEYIPPVDALVDIFKYRGGRWLARDLAGFLEAAVRARLPFAEADLIVPVPLHPERMRRRGYNQAVELAGILGAGLGRAVRSDVLARSRDTGHQARLGRAERLANVKGAFKAEKPEFVRGRAVILVDDVMTTGATLGECASALKAAGAAVVWAATVAAAV